MAESGTYQVADDNLALSIGTDGLGGNLLVGRALGRPGGLLDTTDGGSGGRATSGGAALTLATAASSATLGRDDLVETLVELSRHVDYVKILIVVMCGVRSRWETVGEMNEA